MNHYIFGRNDETLNRVINELLFMELTENHIWPII
jgi:hypothetical protein